MKLDLSQITSISLAVTDDWIKVAREDAEKLRMHYYGENVVKYISRIEGLESEAQIKLRQDIKISNEYIVKNLLKPYENLWAAKGGSFMVEATDEENVKAKIDSLNHNQYFKDIFFPRYITDPNGLLFVENDKAEAWPTYKSTSSIKNMKLKGDVPEYVCFEVDKEEKDDKGQLLYDTLWLVDDAYFYRIKRHNDTIEILDKIKHIYGEVPAVVNSGIHDTLRNIRISPIHAQIDLLDSFLRKNTVKEVYQMKHDFPVYWEYETVCPDCKGAGYIDGKLCLTCNGMGKASKKNVGDTRIIKVPTSQDGIKLAPDILGYVNPPWAGEHQREELKEVFKDMFFSLWGATIEQAENETATGRFIDVQPVNNTLTNQVDLIQPRHNRFLMLLCKFYFPNSVKSIKKVYGDRYLIETADQLVEKFTKVKNGGMPDFIKTQTLKQYIESEYRRDDLMRNYYTKLVDMEPFVHNSKTEVLAMTIPDEDKLRKVYFNEWVNTLGINKVVDTDINILLTELTNFVSSKSINYGEQNTERTVR